MILLQYISFTIRRLAIYLEYCFMKNPAQPWCIFYKSRNTKNRNRNISPFNVICFQIKLEPTPRFMLAQNSKYVAYLQAYTLLFSEQKQSCIMIDSTSKKTQFIIWSKYIFHVNYFICRGTQAFIVNNENMSEQKCLWPTTCIIKA